MKKIFFSFNLLFFNIIFLISPVFTVAAEMLSFKDQQSPSLAPMLEKVMPSVVSINVEGSAIVNNNMLPPQLRQFFGRNSPFCQEGSPLQGSPLCQPEGGIPAKESFRTIGAGVVIDANKGYVVTNNHVIDNANRIQASLNDGRKYEAKVIGKDPRSDIALLQLKDFKNLTEIKIADSDKLRVGDYAVAIGNPFGLGETATSGIVSALGRSGLHTENYENFIQTDAAINRGNSGGALVNLNGELIGLNTAILSGEGGNIGIGFAIPSNMVKSLTAQMLEFGQVKRGELGVIGAELNSELAKAIKVDVQKGAFISQVLSGSAAEKAGIKAGDVVVTINKKPVTSFAALRAEIGALPVGSQVALGLLRDGKSLTVNVILTQSTQSQIESGDMYARLEGAFFSSAQTHGRKGVSVDAVKAGSVAAAVGLKKGDIITGINQQAVSNLDELRKIFDTKPDVLVLSILRDDTTIYLLMQ